LRETRLTWSFTAREGSWGASPVTLHEVGDGLRVMGPQVAFGEPGRADAVWHYYADDVSPYKTHVASSGYEGSDSDPWSDPLNLNDSPYEFWGQYYSLYPHVASNRTGTSLAVWRDSDSTSEGRLFGARGTSSGWESDEDLTGEPFNVYYAKPRVAVDPNGHGLAVWEVAYGRSLEASWFDPDTGEWAKFGEVIAAEYAYNPRVAFYNTVRANVMWMYYDSMYSYYYPFTREYLNGSWSEAERRVAVDDNGTGSNYPPALDSNMNGISFGVWIGSNLGSGAYVYGARFSSGDWGEEAIISDEYSSCEYPDIAVDYNGNAIAVWTFTDESGIQANRYDADSGEWEGVIELSDSDLDRYPKVAFDLNGNAVVVWHRHGEGHTIYARRLPANKSWSASKFSTKKDISGIEDFESQSLQLDGGPNGRFIAVWQAADDMSIYANMYE